MLLALIGSIITITIAMVGVVFRMGHQSARIEALEQWRGTIRQDMHEISDTLRMVGEELQRLGTLIEERTNRRQEERSQQRDTRART